MTDLFDEERKLVPASTGKRFIACLVDYLLCIGFFFLMYNLFGEKKLDNEGTMVYSVDGMPALACFAFWFFVMPVLESWNGQSVGKMLFGIRVVKDDGDKAGLGKTTVRHLFDIVDFLPFFGIVGLIVASGNSYGKRVGDKVADTIVVNKAN